MIRKGLAGVFASVFLVLPAMAGEVVTSAGPMQVSTVETGLRQPWSLAFLPDGSFLVTERDRVRLWHYRGGRRVEVAGLPEVVTGGQSGLLDVMVPHDFAERRRIWLTYTVALGGNRAAALGYGRLSEDGGRLEGFTRVFVGEDDTPGPLQFGIRVVEAPDGTLFLALGDRGTGPDGMQAQDPARSEGKVLHLTAEGLPMPSPPGSIPGLYSLGHRNPQGAAIGPDGALWLVEHGPQGGDEVNRIEEGRNYGWPVITWGERYGGGKIGVGPFKEGMEQPCHYWVPSMAPSGMMFYDGRLVPEWAGDIFVGSLKFDYLGRLDPRRPGPGGYAEERIATPETDRVRDVREAPDGSIWFISVDHGAIYRLAPPGR